MKFVKFAKMYVYIKENTYINDNETVTLHEALTDL